MKTKHKNGTEKRRRRKKVPGTGMMKKIKLTGMLANISEKLKEYYQVSLNVTDKSTQNLSQSCREILLEILLTQYITPRVQQGQTTFFVDGGIKEATFKHVLQSQAQPFVSWLNNALTGIYEAKTTPKADDQYTEGNSNNSTQLRREKIALITDIRNKLKDCLCESLGVPNLNPQNLSQDALKKHTDKNWLCNQYILPKIQKGKKHFTVNDGIKDVTFKHLLQLQAQPFVSWLNDAVGNSRAITMLKADKQNTEKNINNSTQSKGLVQGTSESNQTTGHLSIGQNAQCQLDKPLGDTSKEGEQRNQEWDLITEEWDLLSEARKKLNEYFKITLGVTNLCNPKNLSEKSLKKQRNKNRLLKEYVLPRIREGQKLFSVSDDTGIKDETFKHGSVWLTFKNVLESQAQPYVSWLNDTLRNSTANIMPKAEKQNIEKNIKNSAQPKGSMPGTSESAQSQGHPSMSHNAQCQRDEPLGDKSTIPSVLYANQNHPQLKRTHPEWSKRYKKINQLWIDLSPVNKQIYIQLAVLNRTRVSGAINCTKWELEEPLGDKATIAAVLYTNINHPELKQYYPLFSDRVEEIIKIWNAVPSETSRHYIQLCKENSQYRLSNKKNDAIHNAMHSHQNYLDKISQGQFDQSAAGNSESTTLPPILPAPPKPSHRNPLPSEVEAYERWLRANELNLRTRLSFYQNADDQLRRKLLKSSKKRDSNRLYKTCYDDARAFESLISNHQKELTKHCKLIKSYFEQDSKHDNTYPHSRKASGGLSPSTGAGGGQISSGDPLPNLEAPPTPSYTFPLSSEEERRMQVYEQWLSEKQANIKMGLEEVQKRLMNKKNNKKDIAWRGMQERILSEIRKEQTNHKILIESHNKKCYDRGCDVPSFMRPVPLESSEMPMEDDRSGVPEWMYPLPVDPDGFAVQSETQNSPSPCPDNHAEVDMEISEGSDDDECQMVFHLPQPVRAAQPAFQIFLPKALTQAAKKTIRRRLKDFYFLSQDYYQSDDTEDISQSAERLCTNYIIPTIQSGKTRFDVNDGESWQKDGTFRDVLQAQAQPFVSWLNAFLTVEIEHQHSNKDSTTTTPFIWGHTLTPEARYKIGKMFMESCRIGQNLPEKSKISLSDAPPGSAGKLYSYLLGKIQQGKTKFSVDSGTKTTYFSRVLQSQAHPFVSWLNDLLSGKITLSDQICDPVNSQRKPGDQQTKKNSDYTTEALKPRDSTQSITDKSITDNSKRKLKAFQDFQPQGFDDLEEDNAYEPLAKRSRRVSTVTSGSLMPPPPPSIGPLTNTPRPSTGPRIVNKHHATPRQPLPEPRKEQTQESTGIRSGKDPLALLRHYHKAGKAVGPNSLIIEDGKDITFGDLSWPKEFETTFKASSPGSKPYYYTLDTVLQYLKDPFEPHDAYCQRAKNFGVVRPIHKKALYDYFTGGERPTRLSEGSSQSTSTKQADRHHVAPSQASSFELREDPSMTRPAKDPSSGPLMTNPLCEPALTESISAFEESTYRLSGQEYSRLVASESEGIERHSLPDQVYSGYSHGLGIGGSDVFEPSLPDDHKVPPLPVPPTFVPQQEGQNWELDQDIGDTDPWD